MKRIKWLKYVMKMLPSLKSGFQRGPQTPEDISEV